MQPCGKDDMGMELTTYDLWSNTETGMPWNWYGLSSQLTLLDQRSKVQILLLNKRELWPTYPENS